MGSAQGTGTGRGNWKRYDVGGVSLEHGLRAERLFVEMAKQRGKVLVKGSKEDDEIRHIDYWLSYQGDRPNEGIDVKSIKKIRRTDLKYQERWVWLEIQGVNRSSGWLFGGESTYLAFELESSFVIVRRKSLADLVQPLIDYDSPVVYDPADLLIERVGRGWKGLEHPEFVKYKRYSRKKENYDRQDLLVLVDNHLLFTLKFSRWDKRPADCWSNPI